jgi:hypothetical protein
VWNEYAREKLHEIESARLRERHALRASLHGARPAGRPLAPAARVTGRGLRRLGEAIESWATPNPDPLRSPASESPQSNTSASW